jgi:pyridoxine 5-phosphate synthase
MRATVRGALNLEMAATDEMVAIAIELRPDVVTLVPEKRQERTTEGGLDLGAGRRIVEDAVRRLRDAGIPVSLFIDPTEEAVRTSAAVGAGRIELHTGDYCEAFGPLDDGVGTGPAGRELTRLREAAALGASLQLHVAAGHGLDYGNVGPVAAIAAIEELNIGHAIIARAVMLGMERAVREMRAAMDAGRAHA